MSGTDLAVVVALVLCTLIFSALTVLLLQARAALARLRAAADECEALAGDLRGALDEAVADLERVDRLVGSAEAISSRVTSTSKLAQAALAAPVIKTVALASGTSSAARRLARGPKAAS